MYKQHLLAKGFNLGGLTPEQKQAYNQILSLESKLKQLHLVDDDSAESESKIIEVQNLLNEKKQSFEDDLSKTVITPVDVINENEPQKKSDGSLLGGLAIIGGIFIAVLIGLSGNSKQN